MRGEAEWRALLTPEYEDVDCYFELGGKLLPGV